ncbi:MAG TPA: hypothetical protein PK350_02475 [Deltaproteobacteria bacterium]|nr:hypothetical protein [Deltaproteobacteria bacterium]HPR53628.1 hypothetical protein [Deltaproteobacteria bacterium]
MKTRQVTFFLGVFLAIFGGCSSSSDGNNVDTSYNPVIEQADFVTVVDNRYFPLVPGQTLHYEAETEDGIEEIAVTTTYDTRVVMGVTCTVVHDVATLEGEVLEDTWDWYAQDVEGNVWYFGEDTTSYEDGEVSKEGSWEAGVDGAKPGIVMYAGPGDHLGEPYRQEYLPGVAEDKAEVLGIDEAADVPYGYYTGCVMTKDYSDLEPEIIEHKYFAPGIGQVLAETVEGGTDREELVDITYE